MRHSRISNQLEVIFGDKVTGREADTSVTRKRVVNLCLWSRDDRVCAGRKDLEAHGLSSDLIESLFGRRERRMAGKLKLHSDQAVVYHNKCRTFITVYFLVLVIKGVPFWRG